MKINKKLLLSSIGLASVSIVVPTVLTSCSSANYEFINLNNFVVDENMEGGPTYWFLGVLNDEWTKKDFNQVVTDLGLTLDQSDIETQKSATNNEFKNKDSFKSVLNVATYVDDGSFGEGISIKSNSLLNFYQKTESDNGFTNPHWLSPSDINYDVFDKISCIAVASYNKETDDKETIDVDFVFNQDRKYKWDNGTNYPIWLSIKTPWEANNPNN